MIKTPQDLQELRRQIYLKAKSDQTHRFWGIFVHIAKIETLQEAYGIAKRNGGAPGIDGQNFEDIEALGVEKFLSEIREELLARTYHPQANRSVEIPKSNGKTRKL
jgi:RNA-directed DNA polymerase